MRDFFSIDGAFSKYGGFLADMMILSLMWLVLSIPIVTMGAATTALFYVATRRISEREGYITSDFWQAFKDNFKRATLIWMIILAVTLILSFNILNPEIMGNMARFIFPVWILLLIQLAFMTTFVFPITARFEMSLSQTIKSSFFMANRHFLTTVLCLLLLITIILTVMMMGFLLFVAPGVYAILSSYLLMRVFKKYRPEMDKNPMVELAEIEAQKQEDRRMRDISFIGDNGQSAETEADIDVSHTAMASETGETPKHN